MYRATYAQKTAIQLYYAKKSQAEVVQMLLAEGAHAEQAQELARTYYDDYLTFRLSASRNKRKRVGMFLTIGIVLVAGSIALSGLTYLLIDNDEGSFMGFYGLLGVGLFAAVKGFLDKREADAEMQQLP